MKTATFHWRRWSVIALWVTLLAVGSMMLASRIRVESDLRLFLPDAENPAERILLEQLKDGPGTRLLLAALSGAEQARLATVSEQLADALRGDARFTRVENGSLHPDGRLEKLLLSYRYLLNPATPALDSHSLHIALQARLQELASPAGAIAQELLLRDPTGELENLISLWQGSAQPQLLDGLWFDAAGQRALLLLQTTAPGFDAEQQRHAIDAIETGLRNLDPAGDIHLQLTGPGAFTALLEQNIRADVTALGITEGIASILFLLLVLWSAPHVLLGSLTLATAGGMALAGITLLYPSVHGITLAFGFTLLGVAMDYPVHTMLHLQRDRSPHEVTRHVWPTLRLSIATTCIAYLALVFAGFTGLAQLGSFTVLGLLATAVVIRWLLPHLVNPAAARSIPRWVQLTQHAPRISWLPCLIIPVALCSLLLSRQPLWNNELSGLTPVPQQLQDLDAQLRKELGAPDLRYVIAISAASPQLALQRDEALRPHLEQLVARHAIGGYEQPSQLLPSLHRQLANRNALPDTEILQHNLQAAVADLPFRSAAFGGFLDDVAASRQLEPLDIGSLSGTPLADRLAATLFTTDRESVALVTLSDVQQPAVLADWARSMGSDVLLLDLKSVSEQLVERFRHRALSALSVALVLIAVLMLAQLTWRASLAVLLPVLATLLAEVALFNALGVSLTLFHIVSLLLVGGLCFDYGLFFNRSETGSEGALRTRFSVMACWLSTAGSFALLLISQLPVLRAIGATVATGVTLGFCIALLARQNLEHSPHEPR